MNIEDFAYGVLMEALPSIPSDVHEVIADDIEAGEFFTALLELLERSPQVLSGAAVDVLASHLATLPEGVHRTVGLNAVERFRHLENV